MVHRQQVVVLKKKWQPCLVAALSVGYTGYQWPVTMVTSHLSAPPLKSSLLETFLPIPWTWDTILDLSCYLLILDLVPGGFDSRPSWNVFAEQMNQKAKKGGVLKSKSYWGSTIHKTHFSILEGLPQGPGHSCTWGSKKTTKQNTNRKRVKKFKVQA